MRKTFPRRIEASKRHDDRQMAGNSFFLQKNQKILMCQHLHRVVAWFDDDLNNQDSPS